MLTRRQFTLWSTAALSVGAAHGATPKGDLDKLSVRLVPDSIVGTRHTFRVHLLNANKTAVHVSLTARVEPGSNEHVMAWMNDSNPMSRRVMPPSFIDVPAKQELLAGQLHLMRIDPDAPDPKAVEITLRDGEGGEHVLSVDLPRAGKKS